MKPSPIHPMVQASFLAKTFVDKEEIFLSCNYAPILPRSSTVGAQLSKRHVWDRHRLPIQAGAHPDLHQLAIVFASHIFFRLQALWSSSFHLQVQLSRLCIFHFQRRNHFPLWWWVSLFRSWQAVKSKWLWWWSSPWYFNYQVIQINSVILFVISFWNWNWKWLLGGWFEIGQIPWGLSMRSRIWLVLFERVQF